MHLKNRYASNLSVSQCGYQFADRKTVEKQSVMKKC